MSRIPRTSLKVTHRGTMANQTLITASLEYVDGSSAEWAFYGTPYGSPGSVLIKIPGFDDPIRCESPERFGSTFGTEWVEAYFGDDLED